MSEENKKKLRLVAYWMFSTVAIVFGAITAYIALWVYPLGGNAWMVIKSGFPIWGITALAAAVIYTGYYFYLNRQA